jgi:hypothetical protein
MNSILRRNFIRKSGGTSIAVCDTSSLPSADLYPYGTSSPQLSADLYPYVNKNKYKSSKIKFKWNQLMKN